MLCVVSISYTTWYQADGSLNLKSLLTLKWILLVADASLIHIKSPTWENIIKKPKHGIYCFHESPLPEGRGHAPIQWSLLNKRNNLTISMFKIDEGVDTGLLCYQYNVPINKMDTYKILENKRQIGLQECFKSFLEEVKDGLGNYQTKRSPKHSELSKKNYNIEDLWDSIRMCDNDKFPAFFKINDKKVILKYEVVDDN